MGRACPYPLYGRSRFAQPQGDAPAGAPARAGDDGDFSSQCAHRCPLSFCRSGKCTRFGGAFPVFTQDSPPPVAKDGGNVFLWIKEHYR